MRLERAELWSPRKSRVLFRESPWGALFFTFLLAAIGAGWGVVAFKAPYGWLGLIFGLPCLLFALLLIPGALRGFGSNNWIVLARESGLALKVRSHWNADLPWRDPVVAWIPHEEIRAVRKVLAKRSVPARGDADSTELETLVFLEVLLNHRETDDVSAACDRERELRNQGRTHFHHYPISVPAPGTVRALWGSGKGHVRPGIDKALDILSENYPVEEPIELTHADWRVLDGEQLEDLILELAQSGDTVRAVVLARTRYGMTMTEARDFVDGLLGRQAA